MLTLLEKTETHFNPEMLILAREFHGLTLKDLAGLLCVTPSYLSQIETGTKVPSEKLLLDIVQCLKFPIEHYFEAGRRESAHPTFYRRRIVISPKQLRQSAARMTKIKRNLEKLLLQVEGLPVNLPYFEPSECMGGVEEVARMVRVHLRIPPGPIHNLTRILEDAGVIIIPFDFGTRKIDACSEWVCNRPIIFVNKMITPSRQRHTLAHELGHIIMHRFITEETETEANLFAAEFCLPKAQIKPELPPISLDRLARLKLKWKSSMQALLYRAEELGVISERTARYHWMTMRRYRYHEVEPHEDMMQLESPSSLNELVQIFLNSLSFRKEDLLGYLGVFEDFFDEVYLQKPSLRVF